jgi:hypothetical protein
MEALDPVTRYAPTERFLRKDLHDLQLVLATANNNLSKQREPPCTTETDHADMAAQSWVRLDVAYFRNAKIRRAGIDAALLHLAAICYLGDHRNQRTESGILPADVIDLLAAEVRLRNPERVVGRLVKNELWHEHGGDWLVHDYDTANGDRSDAAAARERQRNNRNRNRDPQSGQYQ